jgi:hypothetical protein
MLAALHEFSQCPPQRQNHAAVAVVGVHAAAAQLHHAAAQVAQAHQVEFGVAVGTAHALGLHRGQHPVGADHLLRRRVAHQQMLAKIVKQIHVMAGQPGRQARAHLQRKHLVPQALGFPNLILLPRPGNRDAADSRRSLRNHPFVASMK